MSDDGRCILPYANGKHCSVMYYELNAADGTWAMQKIVRDIAPRNSLTGKQFLLDDDALCDELEGDHAENAEKTPPPRHPSQ